MVVGPLVQHSFFIMLAFISQELFSITIFAECFIVDALQGSEYDSDF